VLGAILVGGVLLGGLAVWRTPTVALIRLKLALDGQDLIAVTQALDRRALLGSALGDLEEAAPAEPARSAIVPTRAQLEIRLDRILERLIEDPEYRLRVSWDDLRTTLGTLRRTGAVAFFLYRTDQGAEYVVRMRRQSGSWRIVSVERDGLQALLTRPRTADVAAAPTAPPAPPADDTAAAAPQIGTMAVLVEQEAVAPPPEPPAATLPPVRSAHAFVRRLDASTWTVQAASSKDPAEADLLRAALAQHGEDAFVLPVDVQGSRWFRVLVGRYTRAAEAERVAAKLAGR
jgi:hypothetical protein